MENIFDLLLVLINAALGSVGFGSVIAIIIQIGKTRKPEWFSDNSAQNYRLFFALLVALFVLLAPQFGLSIGLEEIDAFFASISKLGIMLLPLLTWLIDTSSKAFYSSVLRGRALIGKSYS